ncbi:MAG: mechanosensitive ion channel family protein [Rhodothermales bacterium]
MDSVSPDTITQFLIDYGIPAVKALVLVVLAFLLAGWAKSMSFKALQKTRLDATLTKFFSNIIRYVILVVALVGCLGYFGIQTASFAAILAAGGFAVGMAMQGTLSNFAAGVMLLVFRPFKVGDVVQINGVTGKVFEIELFTTQLDTPDNRRIIVPNGSIFGSTIENITFHESRRVDVSVGTDYAADLKQTRVTLEAAASAVEGRLADKNVQVYLSALGASSIDWEVRIWCATPDYFDVRDRLTLAVKEGLDAAGIGIPFPQQDVHIDGHVTSAVAG